MKHTMDDKTGFELPPEAQRDIVDELEERARSYEQSGPSAHHTAGLLRTAKAEIERLRGILVEANNTWRHAFEDEVSTAAERLFKKLSARQTDPFGRRVGTTRLTADHPVARAARAEDMPLA